MPEHQPHRKIVIAAGLLAAGMFGFCFALVPLYSKICKLTGISTSIPATELVQPSFAASAKGIDFKRDITIQFIAINHQNLPWDFYPWAKSIKVHPGQNTKVYFFVRNNTPQSMTVQVIPSMTPTDAISHFHKIECFCFRQQTLQGSEKKDMPLIFQVDNDLPKEIHTITLAYTLFDVTPEETRKK